MIRCIKARRRARAIERRRIEREWRARTIMGSLLADVTRTKWLRALAVDRLQTARDELARADAFAVKALIVTDSKPEPVTIELKGDSFSAEAVRMMFDARAKGER